MTDKIIFTSLSKMLCEAKWIGEYKNFLNILNLRISFNVL
jgi:hypothetical protein